MKHRSPRTQTVLLIALFLTVPLLGGCILAAAGAGAAVAWSALGEDAVVAPIEKPFDEVWTASMRVLKNWSGAEVTESDRANYVMATEYDGARVEIRFLLEPPLTKATIKARTGYGSIPAREVASDIADAIYRELASGR